MASANLTSNKIRSYRDFITRSTIGRFERVLKEPGSKKLVCGEWVVVKPGDKDATHNDQFTIPTSPTPSTIGEGMMRGPEIIVRCQCGNRARINGRCRVCHAEWARLNPKQAQSGDRT